MVSFVTAGTVVTVNQFGLLDYANRTVGGTQQLSGTFSPPTASTCQAELHNETECRGQKIGSISVGDDVTACCSACKEMYGCGAFTFEPGASPQQLNCWLHASGQNCQLHPTTGRIAGVMSPSSTRLRAQAFHLSAVRLVDDAGNQFASAQALNNAFLRYLDPDRFLYAWRMVAQLKPYGLNGSVPYGGWMTLGPDQHADLGHFSGHYLSATAFAIASTEDPVIVQKSTYLVNGIATCQAAICAANESHCGYVSAFHISELEAFENHGHVGHERPKAYYAFHKIMAGLLDTYEQTGNMQAWKILLKMASFFKKRIDNLITKKGFAWWQDCLQVEFGGMNELGYNLYAITGDAEHKQLGDLFYKALFMDLIAQSYEYALTDQHANTHLPQVVGVARGWETTGNDTLHYISTEFMRILTTHYTYAATGGSSDAEHWLNPDQLGTTLAVTNGYNSPGFNTEESCSQYNVLKIVRHLFQWAPSARLGDDYEHKVVNGVIGIQKPTVVGAMIYMTPLGNGVSRSHANWHRDSRGWGGKNNSFWCCYGTAIESFAKLGNSIYFHDGGADSPTQQPQLWVVQFVSSTLTDVMHGLNLSQSVTNVRGVRAIANRSYNINMLQTKITISALSVATNITSGLTVSLRIPGWADAATTTVELNGEPLVKAGTCETGKFLDIKRSRWLGGDIITARFGMRPKFVKLNDVREEYVSVGSLHYGPFLLVGMTNGSDTLQADIADIDEWLTLDDTHSPVDVHELTFTAKSTTGNFTLLPLNRVVDQVYTVHFNVTNTGR